MTENILRFSADVQIQAADGTKQPKVSGVVYSGQPMQVDGYRPPVIVDCSGADVSADVPLLAGHADGLDNIVGQGKASVRGNAIHLAGTLTDVTADGAKVIALAKAGIRLQSSIGYSPSQRESIPSGHAVKVNGRNFTAGPNGLVIVRSGTLREVSLLPCGADAQNNISISAKDEKMADQANDNDYIVTDTEQSRLSAAANLTSFADEEKRLQLIDNWEHRFGLMADPESVHKGRLLKARCIAGEVDLKQYRLGMLDLLRAERPPLPAIRGSQRDRNPAGNVLQGALLAHLGHDHIGEKMLGADAMMQARELRCHSLLDLLKCGLQMDQREVPIGKNELIRAAFSTHSITTMLTNTGNKLLMNAYTAFPSAARMIARKLSANDFKAHTGFRITGDAAMEELGAAGEIKHGTLGQATFSYSVKTFARMFGLTRQDVINDDLGAFEEVPRMLGRGAAIAIEEAFWTLVLANTGNYFHANNNNLTDAVLDIDGLGTGVELMLKQVDQDGHPVNAVPRFLVVPPEHKATADGLYRSTTVVAVGTADATVRVPGSNTFFGLYEPIVSPYLSNSSFSGFSSTGWYLFGDAGDVTAFGIGYLDGQESPTVEQSNVDFNQLGIQWRGYIDFGVCQIDPRGAIKSDGDAT